MGIEPNEAYAPHGLANRCRTLRLPFRFYYFKFKLTHRKRVVDLHHVVLRKIVLPKHCEEVGRFAQANDIHDALLI